MPKVPTVGPAKVRDDKAEEPQVEKVKKMPEILSPPTEADLPEMQKIPATTPKRRRMASVLDVVIETTKALSHVPKKIVEAMKVLAEAKAGPSVPIETEPAAPEEKRQGRLHLKRSKLLLPKLRTKTLTTSFDMLRGRTYPKKKY